MISTGSRTRKLATAFALAAFTAACGPSSSRVSTSPPASGHVLPIMGVTTLSAEQLVGWFNGRHPRPGGTYAAAVPIQTLVQYYVEEGAAEGVTGDVAFMHSIVETGWFRFNGLIAASANNFAGIGATDANSIPAVFP